MISAIRNHSTRYVLYQPEQKKIISILCYVCGLLNAFLEETFPPSFCLLYITGHAEGPHEKPCGASSGKLAQILPFAQRFSFVTVVFINEICFLFQFIKIMYVQEVLTNII